VESVTISGEIPGSRERTCTATDPARIRLILEILRSHWTAWHQPWHTFPGSDISIHIKTRSGDRPPAICLGSPTGSRS
jgi:hypothetical protein